MAGPNTRSTPPRTRSPFSGSSTPSFLRYGVPPNAESFRCMPIPIDLYISNPKDAHGAQTPELENTRGGLARWYVGVRSRRRPSDRPVEEVPPEGPGSPGARQLQRSL